MRFPVFFTQSLSFLNYQVRMQKERGRNNATSLFRVHELPCDQQTRNLPLVDAAHATAVPGT